MNYCLPLSTLQTTTKRRLTLRRLWCRGRRLCEGANTTMADPVIGATVQVLLEKLISLTIEEVNSSRDFNKDLEMLTQNVSLIQAFIHDVETPQVEKQQSIEQWLNRLERVAEDAENVFDRFRYESLKTKVVRSPLKKVSGFFSHTAFKRKMSQKINNINKELTAINKVAKDLGLQSLMVPFRKILPIRETDSLVVASDIVGRDLDVAEIKEKILNMREEDIVLSTIPIVGMGGLGKTTVAKRIYNDEHIQQIFEKRIWLCLPEMSETKCFLEQILESLIERRIEVERRDIIVKKLQDELRGKKYLLVLDDLWCVDSTSWHEFVDTLRGINTSRGNCILVTTRMKRVASTVATDLHILGKLTEDHCWSIFKQKAFVDGRVPEELASMGNKIVKMCQGLPLAASALGGLLHNKEKHEWQAILDGSLLVAGEDDNGENSIKKILKLSYDYLPSPHLKKCFAYFAMFPKDYMFEKDQLIQLWMAEGFLRPSQEIPVMEDVGHRFFQILLQNSLLQDVVLDEHNTITHYKMHDLVHDLAGDILKSRLFDPKGDNGEKLSQVRYFGCESPTDQIDKIYEPERLCTLFWRSNYTSKDMLLNFKFLRVLDLSSSGIKELSAKMGKLIYLRYLDLSNTEITALPNSICELYNLQTFRVINCFSLQKLPYEMRNMISLRHIYYTSVDETSGHWGGWCLHNEHFQIPLNMGQLTSLQTLKFFKVGLEKGRQIEELGHLISLPIGMLDQCRSLEFLCVSCCNNLVSFPLHVWEMPSFSFLDITECPKLISVPKVGLHHLTGLLRLGIGPFSEMVDFDAFQLIFNGIQQLLSLRDLEVYGRGHWDSLPYQIMQLSDLREITIADFGIEALPPRLDNLTSLESLTLVRCKQLQHLNFSDAMPKLRLLCISDCPLLEALSDGLGNLVSLEELYLHDCEKLEHLPSRDAMRRLTKLWNMGIKGCPKLEESFTNYSQWSKISHISNIELGGRRRTTVAGSKRLCGKSSQIV
ncbi:putative disease resistance protein RGA4 isoform X2 [Solanum tuberosum]|uniref:putative disease resistance protein RGA4 isoform X1 n=1 Tax=Solanum tuberosum TaxID=4113 RepID=UPI00073A0380|nr:PREDICTED: putative disease resistance protein RGA4 isoform X1 [Solanum tuberosum]XP_015164582.1 PREDICTED: putative disease resistance protein RGA4 isoform X2 [Solanum tuberosum]